MTYNRWSPFSDLLALERDVNSMMSNLLGKAIRPADAGTSATGRTASWAPLIEAFYKEKKSSESGPRAATPRRSTSRCPAIS